MDRKRISNPFRFAFWNDFFEHIILGGENLQKSLAWPVNDGSAERGTFAYTAIWTILSYVVLEFTGLNLRQLLAKDILPFIGINDEDIDWPTNVANLYQYEQPLSFTGLQLNLDQQTKFGQLLLQGGLASPEGPQIVSTEYFKDMTTPHVEDVEGFWVTDSVWMGYLTVIYKGYSTLAARGSNGQIIAWDPEQDMVVSIQSDAMGDWTLTLDCVEDACDYFLDLFDEKKFDFSPRTTTPESSSLAPVTDPSVLKAEGSKSPPTDTADVVASGSNIVGPTTIIVTVGVAAIIAAAVSTLF